MSGEPRISNNLARRRSSGQNLVPLHIPRFDDSEPVRTIIMEGDSAVMEKEEVIEEGKELFQNFVYDQIKKETSVDFEEVDISTPLGYKNPLWAKAGRDLREMADLFARTEERRRVRQRAGQMGINVSYEQFRDLLSQLFAEGGITRERIIVLFYFCSDVAINALRAGKDLFLQFLNWSLSFISEYVCSWVYRQGGWGQVLRSPFNSANKLIMWASAVIVVGLYIWFRYYRLRN